MTDPDQPDTPPVVPPPADVERCGIVLTAPPTVLPANAVFTRTELAERLLAIQLRVERETREQRLPPFEVEADDHAPDPLDQLGLPLTEDQLWERLQRTMWPRGRTITRDFRCVNCSACNRVLLGPKCECVRAEAQLQGLVLSRLLPPPARTFRGRPICDACLEDV